MAIGRDHDEVELGGVEGRVPLAPAEMNEIYKVVMSGRWQIRDSTPELTIIRVEVDVARVGAGGDLVGRLRLLEWRSASAGQQHIHGGGGKRTSTSHMPALKVMIGLMDMEQNVSKEGNGRVEGEMG